MLKQECDYTAVLKQHGLKKFRARFARRFLFYLAEKCLDEIFAVCHRDRARLP